LELKKLIIRREDEKTGRKRGEEKQRKGKNLIEKKVKRWDENNNIMENFVNKPATW
jgi:hypothetical protein